MFSMSRNRTSSEDDNTHTNSCASSIAHMLQCRVRNRARDGYQKIRHEEHEGMKDKRSTGSSVASPRSGDLHALMSFTSALVTVLALLVPQRFHRVETRGLSSGVVAEENSNHTRKRERDQNR